MHYDVARPRVMRHARRMIGKGLMFPWDGVTNAPYWLNGPGVRLDVSRKRDWGFKGFEGGRENGWEARREARIRTTRPSAGVVRGRYRAISFFHLKDASISGPSGLLAPAMRCRAARDNRVARVAVRGPDQKELEITCRRVGGANSAVTAHTNPDNDSLARTLQTFSPPYIYIHARDVTLEGLEWLLRRA